MSLLEARGVVVERDNRRTLETVSVTLNEGEFVGLVGPNGSGKTTLLRTLCGLQKAVAGSVMIQGIPSAQIGARERARLIGYLPQHATFHWPLSVRHAVALGRFPHGSGLFSLRPTDLAAVDAALASTGLTEFSARGVDRLSGGERMRVHLARILAGGHRAIVTDEPITSLDVKFQLDFLHTLQQQARQGAGVLISLHDLSLAAQFCDRLVVLKRGEIVIEGRPEIALSNDILAAVFEIDAERISTPGGIALVPRRTHGTSGASA